MYEGGRGEDRLTAFQPMITRRDIHADGTPRFTMICDSKFIILFTLGDVGHGKWSRLS